MINRPMSKRYRGMIYFAVATLHLYRGSIVAVRGPQTPEQFWERNKELVKRVCDEALTLFAYELSSEQINRAIWAYLQPGQVVSETKVAILA